MRKFWIYITGTYRYIPSFPREFDGGSRRGGGRVFCAGSLLLLIGPIVVPAEKYTKLILYQSENIISVHSG